MSDALPLQGLRVVEFTHMVMGPTCGMVLADLGAEVIKVEPPAGDNTRRLIGAGAGFFGCFNRNKESLVVDVQDARGREIVLRLAATADVFSENFKAGTLERLGLGHEALRSLNPGLVYVSHKGFLPGPYEHRTALDEVVQMMGGLAYMTGPPGRPLRAGSSVNDIMGGMFGAIGALAALAERARTGRGRLVQSGLFENGVLLMAQHMMQHAVTGEPASPMPARISAWAVYDVFTVRDGQQIFLAVVSNTQWAQMCEEFGFADLRDDPRLASNADRVRAREWMMPLLRERFGALGAQELAARFERRGLPYAPITRPQDLFDDPHLAATGGLAPLHVPADASSAGHALDTRAPLLPLAFDGQRPALRAGAPALGAHTRQVLRGLGYEDAQVERLLADGVVVAAPDATGLECSPHPSSTPTGDPRMGRFIDLTAADGHTFPAWVAQPAGRPRGAVVVLQEIFGVNAHIREVAQGYADAGYLAVAPATFHRVKAGVELGYTGEDMQAGIALKAAVEALPAPGVLADIQAAVDYAARTSGGKVGVVGYCWGGLLAWRTACLVDGVAASAPYYGGGVTTETEAARQPRCPVLAHFGEKDHWIPMDSVHAFGQRQAGHGVQVHVYAADHGFNCDHRGSHDGAAAALARERTLAFFQQHVG